MKHLLDLTGKVAVITGSGRGLGKAVADGLAAAGAVAVIADIDEKSAAETACLLSEAGHESLAVQVDVADASSVDRMVDTVISQCGRIDILVNNAGINRRNPCIDMSEQDWDTVIDINLKGTFLCCRAVGRVMVEQRQGKVINVTSLLGSVAQPNRGPYAASKGGVVQLTKVLALEWAPCNINVNGLAPGYVLTELNLQLMEDKKAFDELTGRIPMGRWAQPEEIVGSALFLASPAADYITGQILYVDGGYLCL